MELKCAIMEFSNNHKISLKFNHQPNETAFWNDVTNNFLCILMIG